MSLNYRLREICAPSVREKGEQYTPRKEARGVRRHEMLQVL